VTSSFPITCMLRAVWPDNTAKHAARASGLSVRTAQGWMSERFTPSAATLLRMAERNDNLRAELVRRLTEHRNDGMATHNQRMAQAPQDVLPDDGNALDGEGRQSHGPRHRMATEG
jgi:transcriptional regulator with XRE-family HTH domain